MRVFDLIFISCSFFPWPFWIRIILLPFIRKMLPLKISGVSYESILIGLVVSLAFSSSSYLSLAKLLSPKIKVSSICIPTTPKASFEVVINRHGSYEEVSIPNFS